MKYVDEYRDGDASGRLVEEIRKKTTRCWRVMEVCGGQTHTLIRSGIDQLLSGCVELIHGPGCPVCVTPVQKIDLALAIARTANVILATFGDMMRVPGSRGDLLRAKAQGADVRMVYSPLDAVKLAEANPNREVVFFAIGFETTIPANAMAVWLARRKGLKNFSLLTSQVLVPPAIRTILSDPECRIQGFIAPGHVCSVVGTADYERLVREFRVPIVVGGFEPVDLLEAILMLIGLLEGGQARLQNQYSRSVTRAGNREAMQMMKEVFEKSDMVWRGVGRIPLSGLRLRAPLREYDAESKFGLNWLPDPAETACIAGAVLQGKKKPWDCPAFGSECTPESPLGAPMVSSEGACSAYYASRGLEVHNGV